MEFGACPRCKMDIAPERKRSTPIICDNCGFVTTNTESKQQVKLENKFIKVAIGISIFTVAAFMQVVSWDKYAIEALPLKIKETIGMTNIVDQERLAEICMDLKKYDCVEINYNLTAKSDNMKMLRLGKFQMKRAKWNEAANSFYSFFQNGGEDLEASYDYAKTLAQLGQVDEAVKYFDQVLASKPDVLQVTVVQSYVKLLMDHQRYAEAKKLMDGVRSKGENASMFMETEYKKIQEHTTASRE